MILIESDVWRLRCDPLLGVQWVSAEVHRDGQWHAVVPDCRPVAGQRVGQDEHAPLPAANFHMVPYSNRIRNARFTFQGRAIQLQDADKHAIHGALRKLPWQVTSADTSHHVCEFDSRKHPAINWPWPIQARLEHTVAQCVLTSCLQLTNLGDSEMPAGVGWHPYFVRTVNGSEATLTLPVSGVFPDSSGDCLPDGAAVELPADLDFRQPRKLDASQRIDCCLSGLHDACDINWHEGGIRLEMQASENCRYLVLFNPDMPHFAVEPVTNANDAFNLAEQGVESGRQTLAPGASMEAAMTLRAIIS